MSRRLSSFTGTVPAELDVTFSNLNVSAGTGENSKTILQNVSGYASPGTLLALMGATGSGKTTMLSVLSNRLDSGTTLNSPSKVRYGEYMFSKSLKRFIGFVEQDDVVIDSLTVRQSLTYTARLRMGGNYTEQEKKDRVEDVLKQLRMEKCAETRVGSAMARGVSGGERKRLAIGNEILTRPRVLFLDEPTSGLDSTTAHLVVQCLKELSIRDRVTVVSSIHQPSSQIFHEFDRLCFLHDGQPVYFGESKQAALDFFSDLGFTCPQHYNPPDYFMEVAVTGKLEGETMRTKLNSALSDTMLKDDRATEIDGRISISGHNQVPLELKQSQSARYASSFASQIKVLASRTAVKVLREKMTIEGFVLIIGLSLIAGLLWLNLGSESPDVFARTGLALWITGTWMFFPLINALGVFIQDRVVLRKELYVGAYRLSAYYMTRVVTLLPFEMLYAWLFVTSLYLMALLKDGSFEQYILLIFATWLSMSAFYAVGFIIAAGVPDRHLQTAAILAITFFFAYSGFFKPFDDIAAWMRWTEHVNLLLYGYHLIMYILFHYGPDYTCVLGEDTQYDDECADGVITPQEALDFYDVTKSPALSIGVLLGGTLVLHYLAYRFLRLRTKLRDNLGTAEQNNPVNKAQITLPAGNMDDAQGVDRWSATEHSSMTKLSATIVDPDKSYIEIDIAEPMDRISHMESITQV
eukprot:m.197985 g.197985  ORF g.197985 m.197985 type:complete len:694 (+) comp18726_c0_seq1:57-2138(+)